MLQVARIQIDTQIKILYFGSLANSHYLSNCKKVRRFIAAGFWKIISIGALRRERRMSEYLSLLLAKRHDQLDFGDAGPSVAEMAPLHVFYCYYGFAFIL
jgi:hypothetical protein